MIRNSALIVLGLALALTCGCRGEQEVQPTLAKNEQQQTAATDRLRGFYRTARPYTRWWWFASEIREEDVEHQLDWLRQNGFGGVEIAWVYPLNSPRYARFYPQFSDQDRQHVTPRQQWLSPEWSRIVAHAKRYADRIGLGVDFTFGSAWPFGDSQVTAEETTRVFGQPDFEQRVLISWEYPHEGRVIDHLNRRAFERYAKRMGEALRPALAGSRSGIFVDSWEVETRGIWTGGFGEEFRKRYGYDVQPYMDDLYAAENAGPRYDYMKLVAELVLENFYRPFDRVAHELGAFSRAQCAGAPTDILTAYAAVDVPETEALLYEPAYARIVASAAALSSKRDVSCETFTCLYGWPREHIKQEQTADLKLVADAVFANGVNQVIWHGTPFNGGAGDVNEFYASVHVGPRGALAAELPAFNRYLEKVSEILKRGRACSDVAAYLPLEDAWIAGEYPPELQLPWAWGAYELRYVRFAEELRGHHPLWINHHFLTEARLEDAMLRVGDVEFSSLYVDVDYMDVEALASVAELARRGFPICLKKEPSQPGKMKSERFTALLKEVAALPNVSSDFAKIRQAPPLVAGDDLPDYFCREAGGQRYLFFAHPRARNLRLPLKYGQSFIDHAVQRQVRITVDGKSTDLRLVFEPYQSLMVRVDRQGEVHFVDVAFEPEIPKQTPG